MLFKTVENNVEKLTGLTIEQIRDMDVSAFRNYIEKRRRRPTIFASEFSVIGRGNVLRDNLITGEQLNKDIDKLLG